VNPIVALPLITLALFAVDQQPHFLSRLEGTATELFANFNAGQFDAATKNFNAEMRNLVTPAIMASIKKKMEAEVGEFQSVTRTTEQRQDDLRTVGMLLRYERGSVSLHVTFDAEDKVAAVEFKQITDPLEAAARQFLSDFIAERYDDASANFSDTLRKQLTPARLRTLHSETIPVYGLFDTVLEAQPAEDKGFKIIDLKTRWSKATANVRVIFDNDRHIAGLRITPLQ
jgi:DNA-binding cell septation regulator SpoVG